MDLREFVRDALVQICGGVHDAQHKSGTAIINPRLKKMKYDKTDPNTNSYLDADNLKNAGLLATNYHEGHADIIEFDVAITVASSKSESAEIGSEGKAEGKIFVASVDVSLQSGNKKTNESSRSDVSRIKFRVPVQFPNK